MTLKKFAIFMAFISIIFASSVAIMSQNALVKINSRLEKSMKENADLKARIAASVDELEKLKKQMNAKPASVKSERRQAPQQLTCGKPGTIANKLNNPLNIKRRVDGGKWKGEVGYDSQGHVHFANVEYGIRAAAYVLKAYYKKHNIDTLQAIIKRFCGGNDDYVRFLANRLHLKPDQKFNVMFRLPELLQAMSKYESGKQLPSECLVTLDLAREL